MVHPTTGQIYVITKVPDGESGVYTFPSSLPAPSADTVATLTKVATLHVPRWTGGPAPHPGRDLVRPGERGRHPPGGRPLRAPDAVRGVGVPCRPRRRSFASAFAAAPVALTAPSGEGQGEAIDYAPDGSAYYTISEAPIRRSPSSGSTGADPSTSSGNGGRAQRRRARPCRAISSTPRKSRR